MKRLDPRHEPRFGLPWDGPHGQMPPPPGGRHHERHTRVVHVRRGGPRVGRGDVRAAILLLLAEQPLHGYQVIQLIEERSGGMWRPSAGSVYPALQQLEDEGLVRAEQQEGRRVFHLTDAGRAHVADHRDELAAARDAVTGGIDTGVVELHDLFHQVGVAFKQVTHVGTPKQVAAASDLLANTRRRLYRILADDDGEQGSERS